MPKNDLTHTSSVASHKHISASHLPATECYTSTKRKENHTYPPEAKYRPPGWTVTHLQKNQSINSHCPSSPLKSPQRKRSYKQDVVWATTLQARCSSEPPSKAKTCNNTDQHSSTRQKDRHGSDLNQPLVGGTRGTLGLDSCYQNAPAVRQPAHHIDLHRVFQVQRSYSLITS